MIFKKIAVFSILAALLTTLMGSPDIAVAEPAKECEPVEKKKVKVEGYISKKFKKQRKQIYKEFAEMGYTRVALKVYPMGETSKVLAIGRCVPAHMARHIIQKSRQYSTGVQYLVQQQFLSSHWFGVGATIFDEPSQGEVTKEQVDELLNPDLGDEQFHKLYRKFSTPKDLVPFFGLQVPNAKKAVD